MAQHWEKIEELQPEDLEPLDDAVIEDHQVIRSGLAPAMGTAGPTPTDPPGMHRARRWSMFLILGVLPAPLLGLGAAHLWASFSDDVGPGSAGAADVAAFRRVDDGRWVSPGAPTEDAFESGALDEGSPGTASGGDGRANRSKVRRSGTDRGVSLGLKSGGHQPRRVKRRSKAVGPAPRHRAVESDEFFKTGGDGDLDADLFLGPSRSGSGARFVPQLPDRFAVASALQRRSGQLRACRQGDSVSVAWVRVHLSGATGSVTRVSWVPGGTTARAHWDLGCVQRSLVGVKVGAFQRPNFQLKYPLR